MGRRPMSRGSYKFAIKPITIPAPMSSQVQTIVDEALAQIEGATTNDQLEAIRVAYLGKNGHITKLLKQLGALPIEEKKSFGAAVNSAKVKVQETLDARK